MKAKFSDASGNTIMPARPNFNMHPQQYRDACALAKKLGVSFTDLVCSLIAERLKQDKLFAAPVRGRVD